jgi:hypothetical protein
MPVLAKKAIKRTGLKKYRQIFIPGFSPLTMGIVRISGPGTPCTDPVSHTIGGQGIVIPGEVGPGS